MSTWIIVLIVVALVLTVAGVLALWLRRRDVEGRHRRAQQNLFESQRHRAQADQLWATAQQEAAVARRGLAEAQQRVVEADNVARAHLAEADRLRNQAQEFQQRAAKLDPRLAQNKGGARTPAPH